MSGTSMKRSRKALLVTSLTLVYCIGYAAGSVFDSKPPQVDGTSREVLPYRNKTLCVEARVEDLLSRMTVAEKAGQLFHTSITMGENGTLAAATSYRNSSAMEIGEKFISHFNFGGNVDNVEGVASWMNLLQQTAAETRLGIPISISSDPRHSFTENIGTGFAANRLSQWPESLGLAALRDPELVQKFAEVAREEYMALGIRGALHPQIDLSTEYRWARIANTMGEDANLTSQLVMAYIKGFQGAELGPNSVTSVVKHFPGAGPMENGEDSHFAYGKNQTYPGHNFEHHLIPFKAAIAAGARQMMPYYSRPIGTEFEEVGFSFNKGIITDLLRHQLGFEGIVVSDGGLITDTNILGQDMPARAWGVEHLSELDRAARILGAGVDQFGGEQRIELIIELVENGSVSEERLDLSVRRLLREKFILGLFDDPYIDVEQAEQVVGNPYFVRLGAEAQRASYTLLKNKDNLLPIKNPAGMKVYVEGFNTTYLDGRDVTMVETPEEAEIALVRLQAPYEPRPGGFEAMYTAGSLEFNSTERARQAAIYQAVPTIVDIKLGRPAAIPEIAEQAAALFGNYGASPDAFLDVVFNVQGAKPKGKLPFDLPRSDAAVEASDEDVPFDTVDPVYRFGDGLAYAEECGS